MSVHICVRYYTFKGPSLIFYTDQEKNTLPNNTTSTTLCTNTTLSNTVKSKVCIQFQKFYNFSRSPAVAWLKFCRNGVKLPLSLYHSMLCTCYCRIDHCRLILNAYVLTECIQSIQRKKPGRFIFVMFITMSSVFLFRLENIYLFNCTIRLL